MNLHYEIRICQQIYNSHNSQKKLNVWYEIACIRR